MMNQLIPSFDEWVGYCFTHGYADFAGTSTDSEAVRDARELRFGSIDPITVTQYMVRLFESPSFIIDRYDDDAIAAATHYIFGIPSGYFHLARSDDVPQELQVRCIRALTTMYRDLFDRVCGRRGADPDTDLCETEAVDGAVYMIWDMNCLEGAIMFPKKGAILVEPCLEVLGTVLRKSRTSACRISILHGIGHIYAHYASEPGNVIAQRLRQMVDAYLQRQDIPEWIREYALDAREGAVQ